MPIVQGQHFQMNTNTRFQYYQNIRKLHPDAYCSSKVQHLMHVIDDDDDLDLIDHNFSYKYNYNNKIRVILNLTYSYISTKVVVL
jgi:hypothetical protein